MKKQIFYNQYYNNKTIKNKYEFVILISFQFMKLFRSYNQILSKFLRFKQSELKSNMLSTWNTMSQWHKLNIPSLTLLPAKSSIILSSDSSHNLPLLIHITLSEVSFSWESEEQSSFFIHFNWEKLHSPERFVTIKLREGKVSKLIQHLGKQTELCLQR